MINERSNRLSRNIKEKKPQAAGSQEEHTQDPTIFDIDRSGDWMPVEELREVAMEASEKGRDITLNLSNIDHLDASALQILLAIDEVQQRRGRSLQIVNASQHLRQWFEYAGATSRFFQD